MLAYIRIQWNPSNRTPEMWLPLYSGHFEKSQSMLFDTNSPLKCGHPSNKDTFTGPKGGRFRGVALYSLIWYATLESPRLEISLYKLRSDPAPLLGDKRAWY